MARIKAAHILNYGCLEKRLVRGPLLSEMRSLYRLSQNVKRTGTGTGILEFVRTESLNNDITSTFWAFLESLPHATCARV